MAWRAYYPGDITFDSSETRPQELPDGLVGIVEFLEPPYRRIVDGGDWYWFDGRWHKTDSVWGSWVERPKAKIVKRGIGLPDDRYLRISRRMDEDRQWP